MKRILFDWITFPCPVFVLLAGCGLLLAACGEAEPLPTAVPEVTLPDGVEAQIQLPEEETAVTEPEIIEAEPGQLIPLPRLVNQAAEASGLGGGAAPFTSAVAPEDMATSIIITSPFSNTTFTLNTELPVDAPETAVFRYNQTNVVNLEEAQQLANRFGFSGDLYLESYPDVAALEPGIAEYTPPTIYYTFDGPRTFSIDPWSANYHNDEAVYDFENTIDFATASQIAEAFLQERGLLDFPYAIQPGFGSDVFVLRQIDGRVTNQPEIIVGVSQDGQVSYVSYQVMQNLENLGNYPLISAAEAWDNIQAGIDINSIPYLINPVNDDVLVEGRFPGEFQSWQREYLPGELVQLVGWPTVYLPASGSGLARVQLFPFVLQGEEETINQIADAVGQQITVEGIVGEDGRVVSVNNWALVEEQEPLTPQGIIRRNGEQVLLEAQDGQTYILPNVPADVPDGLEAFVFAWSSQQTDEAFPVLQWENIDKAVASSGDTAVAESLPVEPVPELFGIDNVAIDEVMLSYFISYLFPQVVEESGLPDSPTVLLQPTWKFSGTADSGEKIEFFVQAVSEEYIQQ